MDSLILILAVVGVVMILAGVARMRNQRRQRLPADKIDHSVLFGGGARQEAAEPEDDGWAIRRIDRYAQQETAVDEPRISAAAVAAVAEREPAEPVATSPVSAATVERQHRRVETAMDASSDKRAVYRQGAPDWVIVLNVMAPAGHAIEGPALLAAIGETGMQHGDMSIFHHIEDGKTLFSLANMVKPGTFDPAAMDEFSTPGVSLFMQMPCLSGNGLATFEKMLAAGQSLSVTLKSDLRDERRNVLTVSAIEQLRERIAEYNLKWQQAV